MAAEELADPGCFFTSNCYAPTEEYQFRMKGHPRRIMYETQDTNHVSNEATLDWSELFGHQLITELNSPQELIKVATATIFPLAKGFNLDVATVQVNDTTNLPNKTRQEGDLTIGRYSGKHPTSPTLPYGLGKLETLSMHNKDLELMLQTVDGNRRQVEQSPVSKIVELEGLQATIN
ncbi:unnamed protein product [Sphagnum jensenii]|uniref:Uncharacterized protein n=1 Tax=Sphagnum jensenii TaxID=128206 RepID=A0ABP1BF31_9BRYO